MIQLINGFTRVYRQAMPPVGFKSMTQYMSWPWITPDCSYLNPLNHHEQENETSHGDSQSHHVQKDNLVLETFGQ